MYLFFLLQLREFLSLMEDTVEGYEPPSLITEMHLHLQDLRLEYWYTCVSYLCVSHCNIRNGHGSTWLAYV